jgi:hypothetical protein
MLASAAPHHARFFTPGRTRSSSGRSYRRDGHCWRGRKGRCRRRGSRRDGVHPLGATVTVRAVALALVPSPVVPPIVASVVPGAGVNGAVAVVTTECGPDHESGDAARDDAENQHRDRDDETQNPRRSHRHPRPCRPRPGARRGPSRSCARTCCRRPGRIRGRCFFWCRGRWRGFFWCWRGLRLVWCRHRRPPAGRAPRVTAGSKAIEGGRGGGRRRHGGTRGATRPGGCRSPGGRATAAPVASSPGLRSLSCTTVARR